MTAIIVNVATIKNSDPLAERIKISIGMEADQYQVFADGEDACLGLLPTLNHAMHAIQAAWGAATWDLQWERDD